MTQRSIQMVDVEVTVSLAADGSMTQGELMAWVASAIEAKMDYEREQQDWGGPITRVDPNGPTVTNVRRHG